MSRTAPSASIAPQPSWSIPLRSPKPDTAVVLADPSQMAAYVRGWESIASEALEPNPFYEPWMALPALEAWRAGARGGGSTGQVKFLLVFVRRPGKRLNRVERRARRKDGAAGNRPVLSGVFPLEFADELRGVPVRLARLWRYEHCYLCTPLLRARDARRCVAALLDWAHENGCGRWLLELQTIPGQGLFHQILMEELARRQRPWQVFDPFMRPTARPCPSPGAYSSQALPSDRRSDLKRCQRRLTDGGGLLRYELAVAEPGREQWVREFLDLEARGWKGQEGTALACNPADTRFFAALAHEGASRRQLLVYRLKLDERIIALTTVFVSGDGAFLFKTAYDEAYSRGSPGALLQAYIFANLPHQQPQVAWVDSCAAPGNDLMEELCSDRRAIQSLLVSTGRGPGDLLVASLPLFRWARRTLRRLHGRRAHRTWRSGPEVC